MLDGMEYRHITEWMAFDKLQDEAEKRAALAAKATEGVKKQRRRGR